MKRTGTDFHIIRLENCAAVIGPVFLQRQDHSPEKETFRLHVRGKNVGHLPKCPRLKVEKILYSVSPKARADPNAIGNHKKKRDFEL